MTVEDPRGPDYTETLYGVPFLIQNHYKITFGPSSIPYFA
jgi:hypothetical protein